MTGTEICPKCGATMQLREQLDVANRKGEDITVSGIAAVGAMVKEHDELKTQLAAEQEKMNKVSESCALIAGRCSEQLEQQLAAATARELHSYDVAKLCREQLAAEIGILESEVAMRRKLEGQLATAIEALKELRAEFVRCQPLTGAMLMPNFGKLEIGKIDAAIARIGEGK